MNSACVPAKTKVKSANKIYSPAYTAIFKYTGSFDLQRMLFIPLQPFHHQEYKSIE